MTTQEEVLLRRLDDDGVLTLTMNRPETLNSMTWQMLRELLEAVDLASRDPDVRVVVLTGAGRGFCSGGAIRGGEILDPADPVSAKHAGTPLWRTYEHRLSQSSRFMRTAVVLHTMPKPAIAMVRGPAAGSGLCIAAACDFRIASETAMFTTAFVHAARSGDYGGSYLLPRLVGPMKAREMYLLGDRIDAKEALSIGLVNKVVADDALEAETMVLARRLAAGPGAAYRYIKKNLAAAETMTLEQTIDIEVEHMMRCGLTEDAKELYVAAKEKRKPVFKGC